MSKITELELVATPSGDEDVPIVKDGRMKRAKLRSVRQTDQTIANMATLAEQDLLPRQDLFRPDRAVMNSYLDPNTGAIFDYAGSWRSHYIPCAHVPSLWFGQPIGLGTNNRVGWYRGDRSVVSVTQGDYASVTAVPRPADALYAVVAGPMVIGGPTYGLYLNLAMQVFDFDPAGAMAKGYGRLLSQLDLTRWVGKNIGIFGDSRVANDIYNWWKRVCAYVGGNVWLPNAQGKPDTAKAGRTLADALKHADGSDITDAELATLDILFIQIGINNMLNGTANNQVPTPIGTLTDPTTADTVYGHLNRIVARVRAVNKYVPIVLVSPYYANPVLTGGKIYDTANTIAIGDAYRTFARVNGLRFMDHYASSGVDPWNYTTLLADKLHPASNPADQTSPVSRVNVNQFVYELLYRLHPSPGFPGFQSVP